MQESSLCPILPNHSQIILFLMCRTSITYRGVAVSMVVEDEGPKLLDR